MQQNKSCVNQVIILREDCIKPLYPSLAIYAELNYRRLHKKDLRGRGRNPAYFLTLGELWKRRGEGQETEMSRHMLALLDFSWSHSVHELLSHRRVLGYS